MSMLLPARLFKRRPDSHKGEYGHLFIVAGSTSYLGAACLCAQAAMRVGVGAVTLGLPEHLQPIAAAKLTEVMTLPLPRTKAGSLSRKASGPIRKFLKKADCLLLGPGLSLHPGTKELVCSLMAHLPVPAVIDADGLNALAGHVRLLAKCVQPVILTPHPKEMSRLCGESVAGIQRDRKNIAKDFALRYNVTLILKGHRSVIAARDGRTCVNTTGNPGMATAGCGDVLSGMAAGFLAQGIEAYTAARTAVYLHGMAGDLAAREKGQVSLIASDVIEGLPAAIKAVLKSR